MNPLLQTAISAVREAGTKILSLYTITDFERKTDGSPVTVADLCSNNILFNYLQKTNIPILSEETLNTSTKHGEQLWIIDPLDGTKDFINKTGEFSVMVGLLEHGRPTLGVVYVPVLDTLYYAERGNGTYMVKNGISQKMQVSRTPQTPLRFVCSVNNFAPYMETVTEKLGALKTPRGSIGIKACAIAENLGDFSFSHGAYGVWDVCAPEIILTEAGGMVTDCDGNPLFYETNDHHVTRGAVFSNGFCHADVLEAIRTTPEE